MTLSEQLRRRREEKNLSAAELARRAGISKGYLSQIEQDDSIRPSGDVLYRLAEALGTTVADLLGRQARPMARGVSPSLRAFAEEANLPEPDIRMLAQIRFRGEQPQSKEDWRFLYEAIQRSIRTRGG